MTRVYLFWLKTLWLLLCIWLCNIFHNALVHPLLPFLPGFIINPLHDWTARLWDHALHAYDSHIYPDEVDF